MGAAEEEVDDIAAAEVAEEVAAAAGADTDTENAIDEGKLPDQYADMIASSIGGGCGSFCQCSGGSC